jgi:16S rRNA (adenine1518-N6/adenine1519-N6)-dimethyltransferase
LLEGAQSVTAIEFDDHAVLALQSLVDASDKRLDVILGDALKSNMMDFGTNGHRKIVANLPYNIATPLLIGWLKHIHEHGAGAYQSITIMVQKEVAERMQAADNTKPYGRLSVLVQWLCHAHICFDVPASAFVPPPKVTSSIIHLTPKNRTDNVAFSTVEKLTEGAFGQRRKMIRQTMKPHMNIINNLGLDETSRAENLSVIDFLNIAKALS